MAGATITHWVTSGNAPPVRRGAKAAKESVGDCESGAGADAASLEGDDGDDDGDDSDSEPQLGLAISDGDVLYGDLINLVTDFEKHAKSPMLGLAVYEIPGSLCNRFMEYGVMWTDVNMSYYNMATTLALQWIAMNPNGVIGSIHERFGGSLVKFSESHGCSSLDDDHPLAGRSNWILSHDSTLSKAQKTWVSLSDDQKLQIIVSAIEMMYIDIYDKLPPPN